MRIKEQETHLTLHEHDDDDDDDNDDDGKDVCKNCHIKCSVDKIMKVIVGAAGECDDVEVPVWMY